MGEAWVAKQKNVAEAQTKEARRIAEGEHERRESHMSDLKRRAWHSSHRAEQEETSSA